MMSTVFGLLAVVGYAVGLGAASVIVWRFYRGTVWAYVPALATLGYYLLLFTVAPHPALLAVNDGLTYPPADAARTCLSTVAFGSSLYLLSRRRGP